MQIPIFTDEAGWHGAQLIKAFKARGVDAHCMPLHACLINMSGPGPAIRIPGHTALPQAVFVRGVAGGSLQQVVTRLNVMHMLAMQGVLVYNDGNEQTECAFKVGGDSPSNIAGTPW